MTSRFILRISSALLLTTLTFGASAAPKDAAATAKIDEAINTHYLATDFNKAEAVLLGVVKACGKDGCSANIVARAWMYVGLVRGSGKEDLAGAREAFTKAKELDAAVALDKQLASPEVQKEFDGLGGDGATAAEPAAEPAGDAAPAPATPGVAECTPGASSEIETRRPIPLSCKAPEGVTKAVLAYKEFGGTQFSNVPMTLQDGNFRAPIPCSATKMEGTLQYVVVMKDATGTAVASVGTLEQPNQFNIVRSTTQSPPAFPGEAPPARCAEEVECPPGMPGCTPASGGGWGDSCTPAQACKKGLYCAAGTCENAPSCDVDSDCDSGRCSEGFCDMGDSSSSPGGTKFRKLWLGLHGAVDLHWFSSGNDVCDISSLGANKYSCYYDGTKVFINDASAVPGQRPGIPNRAANAGDNGGSIGGGMKLATIRVLASADYAVMPNLTVGLRLGYAFNGGPQGVKFTGDTTTYTMSAGSKFMPVHAEGRAAWWLRSLAQPGIRPYLALGGGLAQVDAKIKLPIAYRGQNYTVDVYKRLGMGFVAPALGAMIPITESIGILANINAMIMIPDVGFVLEPSAGMVVGL